MPDAAPGTQPDQHIEDYAVVGDCHTAALVGRRGSIDWMCLPRFDSPAAFAALLGTREHGHWTIAPPEDGPAVLSVEREYVGDSFLLRTRWTLEGGGVVDVLDCMPMGDRRADLVRRVVGVAGEVELRQELVVRFGYGAVVPWVRRVGGAGDAAKGLLASAGPDAVLLRSTGRLPRARGRTHVGPLRVSAGQVVDTVLTWFPSHREPPLPVEVDERLEGTRRWWQAWADRGDGPAARGPYAAAVVRSLLVLRALTHEDTGGIVAAATTSLPEMPGGTRNWDYRFCWLRDAALTLEALLEHGYTEEAREWRGWLLRAIAGDPEDVQIMYGVDGARDLPERELDHLPGFGGARPVRIGNGAVDQYQADVLGEVMVALDAARRAGLAEDAFSWPMQRALLDFVVSHTDRKDSGIWEMRGPEQYYVHSRVMVWAALDRGVRAVRERGLDGPAEVWEALAERVRAEVMEHGVDTGTRERPGRGCFVQHYGTTEVDASLLQLPQVGFVAPDHPAVLATVAALEADLMPDGLVLRYRTEASSDGLPPGEHPFLACSFWLVEQYARTGRTEEGHALMQRLLALRNDVGLLSEEYDVQGGHQLGNTPQALSHLALVRAADALAAADLRGATPDGQELER
ncbi:glycoside hydrolase family 15 protein [Quadrisphaera sp. KR29]|uniref:glycoside hydrolase family 15 protein n=1 Tax=Quadrisphaera sp. KR29 TaxID=3461391 RepID=UPI004044D689